MARYGVVRSSGSLGPSGTIGSRPEEACPRLVRRMPRDCPLVVRARAIRIVAGLAGIYVLVPGLVFAAGTTVMSVVSRGTSWIASESPSSLIQPLAWHAVIAHLMLLTPTGASYGSMLVANREGVWIRSRWRSRVLFLPWPAVQCMFQRRWLLDHVICFRTRLSVSCEGDLRSRVDGMLHHAFFDADVAVSTLNSRRQTTEIVAQLRRLSG